MTYKVADFLGSRSRFLCPVLISLCKFTSSVAEMLSSGSVRVRDISSIIERRGGVAKWIGAKPRAHRNIVRRNGVAG